MAATTGSDTLVGGPGNDTLAGLAGDDVLIGGDGQNFLDGGDGEDTAVFSGNFSTYLISRSGIYLQVSNGVSLNYLINVEKLQFADQTVSYDHLIEGEVRHGGDGNDDLSGGIGDDSIYGGNGNDDVWGGDGNDHLEGEIGDDSVYGGSGNDDLWGGEGNDSILGEAGNDKLAGGNGADTLSGGVGWDTMAGGAGNDVYRVNSRGDVISEGSGAGIDTERSSVSDTLDANVENLILLGTANLTGVGNALNNRVTGNAGNNILKGGAGNDVVNGGAGNDLQAGGDGNDLLAGGTGADTLAGGLGVDTLSGGSGNDIFDFNALAEIGATAGACDVIGDFVRGQDRIDLSGLDANGATLTNDAFSGFIGATAAFTAPGQLKFAGGVLYGNTDADATPEFAIVLTGITALSLSDIIA